MNAVYMSMDNSISKYIKQPRKKTLFYRSAIFYVFEIFVNNICVLYLLR